VYSFEGPQTVTRYLLNHLMMSCKHGLKSDEAIACMQCSDIQWTSGLDRGNSRQAYRAQMNAIEQNKSQKSPAASSGGDMHNQAHKKQRRAAGLVPELTQLTNKGRFFSYMSLSNCKAVHK
jgi:hypothetical protein